MRIEWHGPPGVDEPAWVSSPDPAQFPNGIGDALYAINDQIDGWGWSLQYVTDFYASGYPRRWTVIPSSACTPRFNDLGQREYKLGDRFLDPSRVVQIDRNPTTKAHGTSALYAFAQRAYSLLAAGNKSLSVSQDAFPAGYLKTDARLTSDQAAAAQAAWMAKTTTRAGGTPVLDTTWRFETSGIDPASLSLLDTQKWDATVIANAYGVPAPILNMALEGGLTYQNPEALMRMWWLTRLRTRSKRIMDAFSSQMLPSGQAVTQDASDITVEGSVEANDDPQLAPGGKASPAQQPGGLTAIGGGRT
jgi:phage portal protein BeeE